MTGRTGSPSSDPIRVVVVDDHAVVRAGLSRLLCGAPDIDVVAQAADGDQAIAAVEREGPDVVVMDLQMPGTDGVAATRRITQASAAQVLVLTSFSDGERILAALDAGAVGYLLKDSDPDDLIDGVRAVHRGESPFHPRAARELLTSRRQEAVLTPRERQVLELVREGLTNKQIARRLDIRERTVKAHLTSAFAAIGVQDRTQAALWMERRGG